MDRFPHLPNQIPEDRLESVPVHPLTRDQRILEFFPLVNILVRQTMRRLPRFVCAEDVKIAAWFGVIEAVDRYDGVKQVKLKTYVDQLIRGRILDHLRGLMMVNGARRPHRNGVRVVEVVNLSGGVTHHSSYRPDYSEFETAHDLDQLSSRANLSRVERKVFDLYRRGIYGSKAAVKLRVHPSRIEQARAKAVSKMRTAAEIDPSLLHPGY